MGQAGPPTKCSVTLRSGIDTKQGTRVVSFLLRRSVSGLLIKGCSKSEKKVRVGAGRRNG